MRIGYARVSTIDQNLALQTDALTSAGCEMIFKEKASGKNLERPELIRLMDKLRKGDVLVVWKLDRLGRSLKDLIELINNLHAMGVFFVSINDSIDTTTSTGKFIFHLFAVIAEFERELIRERTNAGLAAARARGRKGGRPGGLTKETLSKALSVKVLYDQGKKTMKDIAADLGISGATAYRYLETANNYLKIAEENKQAKLS